MARRGCADGAGGDGQRRGAVDSSAGRVHGGQSGLGSIWVLAGAAAFAAGLGQAHEQHDGGGDQDDTLHWMGLILGGVFFLNI